MKQNNKRNSHLRKQIQIAIPKIMSGNCDVLCCIASSLEQICLMQDDKHPTKKRAHEEESEYHIIIMDTHGEKILRTLHNGQETAETVHVLLGRLAGDIVAATEANSGGNCTSRTWTVKTSKR